MIVSNNPWVGQYAGKDSPTRVLISPFLFAQRQLRNILYLPKLRDLPQGLDLKAMVYDFGFTAGSGAGLAALETQEKSLVVERPILVWGLNGFSTDAAGFLLQCFHNHEGAQRQFFNKHVSNVAMCGSNTRPHVFRRPYMFLRGDSIEIEIKNLSQAASAAKIQVVLYGGEFD